MNRHGFDSVEVERSDGGERGARSEGRPDCSLAFGAADHPARRNSYFATPRAESKRTIGNVGGGLSPGYAKRRHHAALRAGGTTTFDNVAVFLPPNRLVTAGCEQLK